MPFDPIGNFRQFLPGKLQEVWRGAMRLERSIIFVLLVDEEASRISPVPVHKVHLAARLFS